MTWSYIPKPTESSVTTGGSVISAGGTPLGLLLAITTPTSVTTIITSIVGGWGDVAKPTSSVWTSQPKPTSSVWSFAAKPTSSVWTDVSKPTSSVWSSVPKPTT